MYSEKRLWQLYNKEKQLSDGSTEAANTYQNLQP